jgi:hypothetical protein
MDEITVTDSREYSNFHMFNIPIIFEQLKFLLEVVELSSEELQCLQFAMALSFR